jgi:hypothetical protein
MPSAGVEASARMERDGPSSAHPDVARRKKS